MNKKDQDYIDDAGWRLERISSHLRNYDKHPIIAIANIQQDIKEFYHKYPLSTQKGE